MLSLFPRSALALLGLLAFVACERSFARKNPDPPPPPAAPPANAGRRVITMASGEERTIDAAEAQKQGLTLVSLRDDWTPYIFSEIKGPDGKILSNRYRTIFRGLANDQTDVDGQPLGRSTDEKVRGKKRAPPPVQPLDNYLEVYGIPPTLRVLRARFLEDEPDAQGQDRCKGVDRGLLLQGAEAGGIPIVEPKDARRFKARLQQLRRELNKKRRAAKLKTLDELATAQPKLATQIKLLEREELGHSVFPQVEKRLACEQLLRPEDKHRSGLYDDAMREALLRFQRKHKIYDPPVLKRETLTWLGRSLLENDQLAVERVLTERAISAANVLEDGSIDRAAPRKKDDPEDAPRQMIAPTYKNGKGETVPMRNLAKEAADATIQQLGLGTVAASLAFFKRHPAEDFERLEAAIKMPTPPEYYSKDMDLSVEIDRGDVFYDPPFDAATGKPVPQRREHFPRFTLRLRWNGQSITLVRWRTTIGGWRSDLASNGYEYYRYKGSDVGPRVWRQIVAGPVWIAPPSTPLRTLVKRKRVHGVLQTIVNYDEVGPGHLSAYGLVAAYNVVPGKEGRPDWDNGIRVHGSSEYRSILDPEGYSHGCHRLVNHLAVRLFSFVLQHRPSAAEGDQALDFSRPWLWKDEIFVMRLPTRGFKFTLEPPIPVTVLEGNIVTELKKPITTYIPKPGVQYPAGPPPVPPDSPEARAGGE